jgi:toxin ParE1/3/4
MASPSVRLRERAATDIDDAITYYLANAGTDVASRFVDAIERTVNQISRAPRSGSLRFAYELEIPDLRVRPVARFPHLVFYVVGDDAVDVWRILHSRRDMLSALSEESDD